MQPSGSKPEGDKSLNVKSKTIFTGDNLPILRGMNSESIDLIYLDPPFNSNANYAAPIGSEAAGAEFKDTWTLDDIDVAWLDLIEIDHPTVNAVINAAMSNSDKSYLIYMAVRLIQMHRLLKQTGSIYLHCDPTMSHYLKLLMDAIFGRKHFRNEIVWGYQGTGQPRNAFKRKHDTILFYAKSKEAFFSDIGSSEPISDFSKSKYTQEDENGKYKEIRHKDGSVHRQYIRSHQRMRDVWDIPIINAMAKERVGYPTQKPISLLERIIKASSNHDDIVLDPFCGCATTCVASERLQRQWIGIDISPKASELVVERIKSEQGLFQDIVHRTDIPKRTDLGKTPRYNVAENKQQLYGQQAGNCNGCDSHFELRNLEIDHLIAKSVGGTDHINNLQLLCGSCNRIKGNRGQEYLMMRLNTA